jgi:hypothetical protein
MKHSKKLNLALAILLVFLVSNCARVKIKNSEWCGDLGEYGASCFNTHNNNSREISREEWNKERYGMICTRAENYKEWKSAIEKLCKLAKFRCTFEEKQKINEISVKIENFIEIKNFYNSNRIDI